MQANLALNEVIDGTADNTFEYVCACLNSSLSLSLNGFALHDEPN